MVYCRPNKNFFTYVKNHRGLDLENTVVVAIWLPSLALEIALKFQMYMYMLGHYHAIDKHIEILSFDVVSDNILSFFSSTPR